ncbi:MAG: membrane protease YdiL (CAAX protease family) [Paraglaciecola sp.]|jgi:membrane protease YdiL (CAAX protease family)
MESKTAANKFERREAWRALLIFMFLVIIYDVVFDGIMIIYGHSSSDLIMGVMWGPGLAAICTCLILKRKISSLPWNWGAWKWNRQAYLLPIVYGMAIYLPVWLLGLGGSSFGNEVTMQKWSANVVGEANYSTWSVLFNVLMLASFGVIAAASRALGEEIGWRGFMIWEMRKLMPFWAVGLFSGLIWAMWHWPAILFTDYNAGEGNFYLQMFLFTASVVPVGIVLAYYSFKSKSLWPAVILHASHNLFIQKIYTPITVKGVESHLYIDEFGIMMPIVTWILAIYFLYKAQKESL